KDEKDDKKDDASTKNRPYPEVKDPSPSALERKKKARKGREDRQWRLSEEIGRGRHPGQGGVSQGGTD
ncbi:hypothetical protein PENTCL1PPCAC_22154, partial [Pristionchus entomophagus]